MKTSLVITFGEEGVLLVSSKQNSGMLVNILYLPEQYPTAKNYPAKK